jgi:LuxR family transcriptional regulator, maltose regulon positive regulatory protein
MNESAGLHDQLLATKFFMPSFSHALILDDYHLLTAQAIHTSLTFLLEHLPPQLHLLLATRADPPLPLSLLRARGHLLELRTDDLRCQPDEAMAFLEQTVTIPLPEDVVEQAASRTEGWLAGLQLVALSLQGRSSPGALLEEVEEVSGSQRYIFDYLMEEVFECQSAAVQTFLLSTSILTQLSAPLCDAVLEQSGSQQVLEQLERANLFLVSLDGQRQWYRYHALFAEALRHHLEETQPTLVPGLHSRASQWYARAGRCRNRFARHLPDAGQQNCRSRSTALIHARRAGESPGRNRGPTCRHYWLLSWSGACHPDVLPAGPGSPLRRESRS